MVQRRLQITECPRILVVVNAPERKWQTRGVAGPCRPDTKDSKQYIRQEWKVLQGRLAPTPRGNIIFMNEPTMHDNQKGLKLKMA